ncbi:hypothetical protein HPB50_008819 [Hyalomma asiaticum]|uniref:Uncharacterized protein n=1 Tax=Hyalomma asiaticum TaxID=266040 RepID=A0ACB7SFJ0_HYAAI|nr:hypothetical protein HPB50_008819 [Hyalomma asiaticum]
MLLTKPMLFFVQALLLVSANASSTGSTCSEHNMGDSVDGIDYQRCPLRPKETVLRRIISPRLLFPSSVTTRDLLIKEGLQRFFGSGHGEAVGAMLLTKPMLFFVQRRIGAHIISVAEGVGACDTARAGDTHTARAVGGRLIKAAPAAAIAARLRDLAAASPLGKGALFLRGFGRPTSSRVLYLASFLRAPCMQRALPAGPSRLSRPVRISSAAEKNNDRTAAKLLASAREYTVGRASELRRPPISAQLRPSDEDGWRRKMDETPRSTFSNGTAAPSRPRAWAAGKRVEPLNPPATLSTLGRADRAALKHCTGTAEEEEAAPDLRVAAPPPSPAVLVLTMLSAARTIGHLIPGAFLPRAVSLNNDTAEAVTKERYKLGR